MKTLDIAYGITIIGKNESEVSMQKPAQKRATSAQILGNKRKQPTNRNQTAIAMTKFDYELETSKLLNGVLPEARKIITSQPEYFLSVVDNDFPAAYQFVYDWLHGKAKSIAGAQKITKQNQEALEKMKQWRK